jgi:hypothetical protein
MPAAAGLINDIFQLSRHRIIDPVFTAQGADRRGDVPHHHDSEPHIYGKGSLACFLHSSAKGTLQQIYPRSDRLLDSFIFLRESLAEDFPQVDRQFGEDCHGECFVPIEHILRKVAAVH